jgi:protein involved in temperature-dependent protein secretion
MSKHNILSEAKKDFCDSANDDIKNQPIDMTTKHHLISLLHLDNQSGLQYFVKHKSLDYDTLERYLYSDIIPSQPVSTNSSAESKRGGG